MHEGEEPDEGHYYMVWNGSNDSTKGNVIDHDVCKDSNSNVIDDTFVRTSHQWIECNDGDILSIDEETFIKKTFGRKNDEIQEALSGTSEIINNSEQSQIILNEENNIISEIENNPENVLKNDESHHKNNESLYSERSLSGYDSDSDDDEFPCAMVVLYELIEMF